MTCIVGYKFKDTVCLAGDLMGSNGYTKEVYNNSKVFAKGDVVFGYTTSFRFGQILEYHLCDFLFDETMDTKKYLITVVVVQIKKILKEFEYDDKKCGTALVAIKNRLFTVHDDFCVIEHNSYSSVGSGESFAKGSIHSQVVIKEPTSKVEVESMLQLSIKAASYHSTSVSKESTIIWT